MPASLASDFKLLQKLWRDAPTRRVLPNGLTVIQQRDPAATVASVQVWVKTGSIHEQQHLGAGLSHYLEHLLFKGTERREGREISTEVQAHGGYINAYTSFERTVYYIDIPAEHAPVAVDILGDAVLHSTLPADEVEREKQVILREIDMGLDDPDLRLWQSLFETVYRTNSYREPIIGHRDVFAAVDRDALVDYYRNRYVPNNIVLVVTGGFDTAAIDAAIEQHWGKAPRRRLAPVILPVEPTALAPRVQHLEEDVEIVRGALAWTIPGLTHPDAATLDVLAMILGNGDSSLLWEAIREKARLVHSIDVTSWNPGDHGLFYLSFICDLDERDKTLAAIPRELRRIEKKGFTAGQVRKAVRQLVVGEINGRKTVAGRASRLGVAEVVAGDMLFTQGYFERLKRITPASLRRALRTYLLDGHSTTVTLTPKAPAAVSTNAPAAISTTSDAGLVREQLANGTRLLLQPDSRLPNLHFRLLCLGGGAFEPTDQRGTTALMATLLARDTAKRSAAQVAGAIESVGGSLSPVFGNNTFGLSVEVLPGDVDLALDLLAEAALKPTFTKDSFEIERDAQIADLQQDVDDIVTIGRKQLRKRFFGSHPLAVDAHGEVDHLRTVKPRDLVTLHRRLMVGSNVVLSVAGDFNAKTLAPKLRMLLRRFKKAALASSSPTLDHPAEVGDFVEIQPRQQAVVFQGYLGPGVCSEDFHVAEVADELFSGMSSRLFERVREEKGLAYYVRSSRVVSLDSGMFYFYAGTAPGKETEVLKEIELEIARMARGRITKAELTRCQTRLCAGRRMGLQSNGSRAMHVALNELYGQPLDDGSDFEARINAVTIKSLAAFARRYLKRDACTQVVVRP
ncbi:M16 family metallopeptidase [Synoicihabitans lomoniglobus]|uniref:Pitrilysin family protein n=1 Tax=Synoicihabitans lomoniglobus TaxID=2909285 RepID=A0AAF0I306_9BACT|nr:insulinase family protein [Opitutaceae bacterium LMO-M01]WED66058.1 pitrilysin family protein [Opitutaceae bacterium LMO-M01]